MPCSAAKRRARSRSRAATTTTSAPLPSFTGSIKALGAIFAAPSTPNLTGAVMRTLLQQPRGEQNRKRQAASQAHGPAQVAVVSRAMSDSPQLEISHVGSDGRAATIRTRQVLFASLVGTSIEIFDFYIYATAAVLVFP